MNIDEFTECVKFFITLLVEGRVCFLKSFAKCSLIGDNWYKLDSSLSLIFIFQPPAYRP